MNRRGFTFVEMLISVTALAIIMLALADFSFNTFNISYNHTLQVENANQSRFSSERILNEINKAAYIFPANQNITLITDEGSDSINTNDAIAMLIPANTSQVSQQYNLVAFYLLDGTQDKKDLYEFRSSNSYNWSKNTVPISSFSTVQGNKSLVANDICENNTELTYILNSDNGVADSILQGSISGVSSDSPTALIKGVDWIIATQKNVLLKTEIKGIAKNVPRIL